MRAPLPYYGGKSGMAPTIVSLMPAHRVYMEPFFGSGAVLFAKTPSVHEIVNDVDGSVVNFFTVLRDQPEELERVCRLTPHARAEYRAAVDLGPHLGEVEWARRFWVRINQSFAKASGTRTGWSVTTARSQSVPATVQGRIDRFHSTARRLARVSIECCDAADLVSRLATADTVLYVDPPYLASTRNRQDRNRVSDYAHDMGDEADHERLAEVLRATPATVILSGYHSPLYDRLYGDWPRMEIPVLAHASGPVSTARAQRTEVLWSNRPMPEHLFSCAGARS